MSIAVVRCVCVIAVSYQFDRPGFLNYKNILLTSPAASDAVPARSTPLRRGVLAVSVQRALARAVAHAVAGVRVLTRRVLRGCWCGLWLVLWW